MRSAARLLLTWLLLLALPLQGWAMAGRICHADTGSHAHHAMAPGTEHPSHAHAHGPHHANTAVAAGPVDSHALARGHAPASAHHASQAHPHAAAPRAPVPAPLQDLAHPVDPAAHPFTTQGDTAPGAAADPSHPLPAGTAAAPAGCSHCAACCVGAVLFPGLDTPAMAPPRLEPAESGRPTVVSFLTDGPERPPRTL